MLDSLLSSHADYLDFYARQGLQIYYPRAMIMSLDNSPAIQASKRMIQATVADSQRTEDAKRPHATAEEESAYQQGIYIVTEYRYKHMEARNNNSNDPNKSFQIAGLYTSPLKANVKAMRHFASLCGEDAFVEDCSVKRLSPSDWIHQHLAELTARRSDSLGRTTWVVTDDGLLELLGKDDGGWLKIKVQQRPLDEGLY